MYKSKGMDEFYQEDYRQGATIIDVREVDEFTKGHIPSAKNIPLSELPESFSKLEKQTDYHVICHSGGRSAMACEFLAQKGYNVVNVMGGMSSWKGEIINE